MPREEGSLVTESDEPEVTLGFAWLGVEEWLTV